MLPLISKVCRYPNLSAICCQVRHAYLMPVLLPCLHIARAWSLTTCHTCSVLLQMMASAQTGEERAILAQAFCWRELLQRGIDGCDATANMSPPCLALYDELPGPNLPLPCGYSVRAGA